MSERLTVTLVQTSSLERGHAEELSLLMDGRPVVALQVPEMTESTMLTRVSEWVALHRRALDERAAGPPHVLVGWSFGGVVALELARVLDADGQRIAHVGLIDAIRPRIRPIRLRDAVGYHLVEAALLGDPRERRAYLLREAKIRVGRRLRRTRAAATNRIPGRGPRPGAVPGQPTEPNIRSIHRSYLNHRSTPIDIPVSMYVTRPSTARCNGDPSLRWSPFLRGGFTTTTIEGDHYTLWQTPHVESLATALSRDLASADELFA